MEQLTDREIPAWNDEQMHEYWRPLYTYAELRLEPLPSYGPRFAGTLNRQADLSDFVPV